MDSKRISTFSSFRQKQKCIYYTTCFMWCKILLEDHCLNLKFYCISKWLIFLLARQHPYFPKGKQYSDLPYQDRLIVMCIFLKCYNCITFLWKLTLLSVSQFNEFIFIHAQTTKYPRSNKQERLLMPDLFSFLNLFCSALFMQQKLTKHFDLFAHSRMVHRICRFLISSLCMHKFLQC